MNVEIPHITICSVEPIHLVKRLMVVAPTEDNPRMDKRCTEYTLESAHNKNQWSICKVYDGVVYPNRYDQGEAADRPTSPAAQMTAPRIAESLLQEWQNKSLQSKSLPRGIGIIDGDIPTGVELTALNKQAVARMRVLVYSVDQAIAAGHNTDFITQEHIDAANFLGEVRDWSKWEDKVSKKKCLNCQELANAGALSCPNCAVKFSDFYQEEGYTDKEIEKLDPIVWTSILRKRKPSTPVAPVPLVK